MSVAAATGRKKRVTLTLDPAVHAEATRVAKLRGKSLSALVEGLLAEQTEETAEDWLAKLKCAAGRHVPPPPGADPRYDHYMTKWYPEESRADGRDQTPQPGDPGFEDPAGGEQAA